MTDCCLRIKELMNSLAPKEQQIARYILDHPTEVVKMSIKELAEGVGTSVSSVVRLCKSAGYAGYKEFCRILATDLALNDKMQTITYSDVRPGDSIESIINSVCSSNIRSIENTGAMISSEDLGQVVELICNANRVDFYGVGSSGLIAMDAHNKFIRIRKLSLSCTDPHEQCLTAASLRKGDVAVLISYSGDTKDILETADVVRQTEATLVSVTRYGKTALSQKADISLYSSTSENMIRSGVMGQRIGQLTLIDILYTAVVSRQYNEVRASLDETLMLSARKHVNPINT